MPMKFYQVLLLTVIFLYLCGSRGDVVEGFGDDDIPMQGPANKRFPLQCPTSGCTSGENGEGRLSINVRNNAGKNIIVWLDDLPFCDRWVEDVNKHNREVLENDGKYDQNCGQNNKDLLTGDDWKSYLENKRNQYTVSRGERNDKLIRIEVLEPNAGGSTCRRVYDSDKDYEPGNSKRPVTFDRYRTLTPNQILRVTPPHDNLYQKNLAVPQDEGRDLGINP